VRDWLDPLIEHLDRKRATITVTCVEVRGSAPCSPGSRMIVTESGTTGTIGGGNLEYRAIDQARKLIAADKRCLVQSLPLGPLLAQCCGGRVKLVYERFDAADVGFFRTARTMNGTILTRCLTDGYDKWLVAGTYCLPLDALNTGAWATDAFLASAGQCNFDGTIWRESLRPARPLVCIFGGGHIGKALVHVLAITDCELVIVDPRDDVAQEFAGRFRVAQTDDPAAMDLWWRKDAVAVVLTHSHELDYAWVSAILRRADSAYCGLIGSRTKRNRFIHRLRAEGLTKHQISHLTSPIGLTGLNSKDPAAVAISTGAQLLPYLVDIALPRHSQDRTCLPSEASCI